MRYLKSGFLRAEMVLSVWIFHVTSRPVGLFVKPTALWVLCLLLVCRWSVPASEKEKAAATAPASEAAKPALSLRPESHAPGDRTRWAYQSPKRSEVPNVQNPGWIKTPVDAFILARLDKEGLSPAAPADRALLLRRVYFDLTGLPPLPEEVDAFVKDTDPKAYEKVVESLLSSPRYGERWGQHWLDVVRYADTDGYEYDTLRPDAWRYRDYVIKSFNTDKPYDRFILEQLAGDELAPGNQEVLVAVGFNRLASWRKNAGNQDEDMNRNEVLTEQTNAVGAVFMGTTVACARCHDHLFDPIKQSDYYRLQAFFAPAVFKEVSLASPEAQAAWEAKATLVKAEMEKVKKDMAEIEEDWKRRLLEAKRSKLSDEERAVLAIPAEQRHEQQKALAAAAEFKLASRVDEIGLRYVKELKDKKKEMMAVLDQIEARMPEPLPAIWTLTDDRQQVWPIHILDRGVHTAKGARVGPRVPGLFLADNAPEIQDDPQSATTGRRLALARWLISPENPLTARVMVNRLWHYHFNRGIVATPNDFGAQGATATHPELLDWLATEFVQQNWSIKAMHRLMVLSNTYRLASEAEPDKMVAANFSKDPDNRLFWRYNRRRIEAEAVRDAILSVSGNLNPKMDGPGVFVPVPEVLVEQLYKPKQWVVTPDQNEHHRRTIYLIAKRNLRLPFMEAFDAPDLQNSCARREQSTHALQSLELLNGHFSNSQAQVFAGRLLKETGWDPQVIIQRAFRLAVGRRPSSQEAYLAGKFLTEEAALSKERAAQNEELLLPSWMPENMDRASAAALCEFSLAMFNLPGFLYLN
jgi:Protein of unknown function (DUF1553)/Protein of unknown function (DUF1549)